MSRRITNRIFNDKACIEKLYQNVLTAGHDFYSDPANITISDITMKI